MLRVLDTFGGGRQTKSRRYAQDRANDDLALVTLTDTRHEASIDLDLVKAKREQLAQGGIPRSEIVKRDAYAGLPKFVDHGLRNAYAFHDSALGNFDLQTARTEPGLPENRQNSQSERTVAQLNRRNV